MVAVIGSGISIRRAFLYNENKVKHGVAKCLMAANYPMDLDQMDQNNRLNMLLRTASLNPDVKRNSIHISLNFAPGEQLSDNKLKEIAGEYMQQIGFADQPFLVYRHDDAAHPHIHIATTNIRPDGTCINTYNIGKNQSEAARKSIENKYNLVKAENHRKGLFQLKPVDVNKVIYGQEPTRKAISNVLQSVLLGYKYTSIAELNAVLNQYNISADRGAERSRIYAHQGLVYHVLDAGGKLVGVPVKASSFYNSPGLKFLEKKYLSNDVARQQHKIRLKNTIDLVLLRNPKINMEAFVHKLKLEGIHVAIRQNDKGDVYGLTYVDHRTKCVFNGSVIGKAYSAKGLLEKLQGSALDRIEKVQANISKPVTEEKFVPVPTHQQPEIASENNTDKGLLEGLMEYEYSNQGVPFDWKRKKKKKKKR